MRRSQEGEVSVIEKERKKGAGGGGGGEAFLYTWDGVSRFISFCHDLFLSSIYFLFFTGWRRGGGAGVGMVINRVLVGSLF